MSYFLKKARKIKGVYLQIFEGVYDPAIGDSAQRSIRAVGHINELQDEGIEDPVSYFQREREVDQLHANNQARRSADRARQIGAKTFR